MHGAMEPSSFKALPSNIYAVNVTVKIQGEDKEKPTIEIIYPEDGDLVSGIIKGTVSDNIALVSVEIRIELDTTELENGEYTIEARAFDGTQYSEASVDMTIFNNNAPELLQASVSPSSGDSKTLFTFTVTMSSEGNDYLNGTVYSYSTTLNDGLHVKLRD